MARRYPILGILFFSLFFNGLTASAMEPRQVVESFHAVLLETMKSAEKIGVKGRFEQIHPAISEKFDLTLMTALASGRHWRKASEKSRKQAVSAFGRFSAATYASRFNGFSGQRFVTLGVEDGPRKTRIVRTKIENPEGENVAISYVMRQSAEGWRVADILLADGISEIATKRSEFRQTLMSGGLPALTKMLEDRTAKLLSPS